MTLHLNDKYCIIENHINITDKTINKLDNYFENYLNSDIKILIPDYINQIIYFQDSNIINRTNIKNQIKTLLLERRNNIRTLIKKENFELSGLNKFLKSFIEKIEYINNLFKNDLIIKYGIENLSKLIISDSIIMLFIENKIITFDKNIHSQIEILIKSIKKFDSKLLNEFLKILCNIFKRQIIDIKDTPLPQNIKRINKYFESIQYYKNILNYYYFIKDELFKIDTDIRNIIIENLCDIIKNNSISEIEFVLVNSQNEQILFSNIYHVEQSLDYNNVVDNIILLIDKKSSSENLNIIISIITILNISPINMQIISQKITKLLDDFDNINNILDNYIKNNKINEVSTLIILINQIKNKDIFINKYHELLIKRLLFNFSEYSAMNTTSNKPEKFNEYIDTENLVLNIFNKFYDDKLLYKSKKIIHDTLLSHKNKEELNIHNLSVITTSYNNWDINQIEGLINQDTIRTIINTNLGSYLNKYQEYYLSKYNDRILNWFPHFGEVNITYLDQELKMLPIQFIIVEMFNDINKILVQDIINSKVLINYSTKFKYDIIGSLVLSGLFSISNDYLVLSMGGNFKENLIEIFFNNSDYTIIWEEKRNEELLHTREEITKANINKILKTNNLNNEELFNITKETIKVFELDINTFDKSIKSMIDMDYIKLENEKYIKLFY